MSDEQRPVAFSHLHTSAKIENLANALANAQKTMKMPDKNKEVTVKTKTGGTYKFWFATMDNIVKTVQPKLAEQGLSVIQPIVMIDKTAFVLTRLMHASGEWIESMIPVLGDIREPQQFGSGISYARRYAYSSLLGIVTDDDDDGNASRGDEVVDQRERQGSPGSMREHGQNVERERQQRQEPKTDNDKPPEPTREAIPIYAPDGRWFLARTTDKMTSIQAWMSMWDRALNGMTTMDAVNEWLGTNRKFFDFVKSEWPDGGVHAQKLMDERMGKLSGFPPDTQGAK